MELLTMSMLAQLTNRSRLTTDDKPRMAARSSGMKLKKDLCSLHLNERQRQTEDGEEMKWSGP